MAEQRHPAQRIRAALRQIADRDVESEVVRRDDLGPDLAFSDCSQSFESLQRVAMDSLDLRWEDLSEPLQAEVVNWLEEFERVFARLRGFSATSGQRPASQKAALTRDFHRQVSDLLKNLTPLAAFLSWSGSKSESYQRELESSLASVRQEAEQLAREAEDVRGQAAEALAATRLAAREGGVTQQAHIFHRAAQRYEISAYCWLAAAVLLAAGTVATAFLLLDVWRVDGDISQADVLQLILAKGAALAVTSLLTVTAVRVYRSNAHLAVINRHRADALRTFRAFVEGTDDEGVKDKVLLAAAHAAFGQTPTGLVGEKAEGGSSVEVLDGIWGGMIRKQ